MASLTIALNAGVRATQSPLLRESEQSASVQDLANAPGSEDRPEGQRPKVPRPVIQADAAQDSDSARNETGSSVGADGLTAAERDQVDKLRARDAEVRRHEEAHARVGGQYAGQPSYSYQTGPDGKRYAIGGEVPIDVAPVPDDPEATIDKMSIVKRAALAPAEPSGQDRRVAALADRQSLEAQATLNAQLLEEQAARLEELGGDKAAATGAPGSLDLGVAALGRGEASEPGQKLTRAA
ncbi:MAG: putative metalloprotease CJM1_0395 family protein [Paracoccaceae bacterium]